MSDDIGDSITTVDIRLKRTVSLGPYETFSADIRMVSQFPLGQYTDAKYENLRSLVAEKLHEQICRILSSRLP